MQKRNQPPISLIALTLTATLGVTAGCTRADAATDTLPTVSDNPSVATQPTSPPVGPPTTLAPTPAPTAAPTTAQPAMTTAPTPPPVQTTAPVPPPGDDARSNGTSDETAGEPGVGTKTLMTWEAVVALIEPQDSDSIWALDWGDVDGDGDEDVLVRSQWCGAACAQQIDLVRNDNGIPVRYLPSDLAGDFERPWQPWFVPSSAVQTRILGGDIDGSTITITGNYLCGEIADDMDWETLEQCTELERTATYQLVDGALQPISINPPFP